MYALLLTIIIIVLVIIAACISYRVIEPPILVSDFSMSTNTEVLREQAQIPFTSKSLAEIPHGSNPLGMYNMSVRKIENGYSGLIRGTSCDGCRQSNPPPLFSYAYHVSLNDAGDILETTLLDLDYESLNLCRKIFGTHANGIEDAKLFMYRGQEWAIANVLGSPTQIYPCINTMCIFKVSNPQDTLRILTPPIGVNPKQKQKNWAPFEWNDKLLCEYSITPHIILEIDLETGITNDFASSGKTGIDITSARSFRTGPASVYIANSYLGIGHVQSPGTPDYTHFFYTFESEPPFALIGMTDLYKLDFRTRIQFVAGLSEYKDNIYISYGINDCENRISVFEKQKILDLIQPVH